MGKKRNWEIQYEKYKTSEMKTKFEELKDKFERKTITREENAEYQKMKKVMGNLPKVDNIKEYMDKLESDLTALKEEYRARKQEEQKAQGEISYENLDKEINQNLEEQDKLLAKRKENNKQIAQSTDKEEIARLKAENADIDQELSKLKFQAAQNNKAFIETQEKNAQKATAPKLTKAYLAKYSDEDLRTKCFEISTMLSKCNMIASNLMKGLSIDAIQVKLEGWKERKFTSKDSLPLTRKEKEAQAQAQSQSQTKIQSQGKTSNSNSVQQPIGVIHGATPKSPAVVSDFAKAFPRLSKRFPNMENNFLGKALLAIKNHLPSKEEKNVAAPTTVLPKNANVPQTNAQTNQKTKKEIFRDYVKYDVLEVADKGIENVEKEKREELEKKAEAMRPIYAEESKKLKEQQMEERKKKEEEQR